MDTAAPKFLFLFLLFILIVCSSGSFLFTTNKDLMQKQLKRAEKQTLHSYRRQLLLQTIQEAFTDPLTTYPTTPVTNPVTTPATITAPPDTSTPPTTTIPPITVTPTPITFPPTTPITNPINPPVPVTNPVTTPSTTIPGTTYPTPTTTPAVVPPATTVNAPAVPGQSWCVAKGGLPENALQSALDYACGIGGADCSAIQEGASCYNPNSMQNHASYAFNSYYQRNPVQTSCDFGGTAMVTNVNPSSGSCIFTTFSSSSASPTMPSPVTTTPTTESSSGATPTGLDTPPSILNATNPALGGGITGYGEGPLAANNSSATLSRSLQPFIGYIIVAMSIITGRLALDM